MDDPPDLAEAIIEFAESLPATIRADILCFVLIYGINFSDITAEDSNLLPALKESLRMSDALSKMGTVLRFIGIFDHVLWRASRLAPLTKSKTQMLAAKMPAKYSSILERVMAAEPLRTKHFERAWSDWSRLRGSLLTPDMLVYYESSLLRSQRPL